MQNGHLGIRALFLLPVLLLVFMGLKPMADADYSPGRIGKFLNGVYDEEIVPWRTADAFSKRIELPLWVIPKWDSTGYIYTQRRGRIWEIEADRSNPNPRLLLDIGYWKQGLSGRRWWPDGSGLSSGVWR